MKLSHYVQVDDGGNYVTFCKLNVCKKIKKITPQNKSLGRLCSSAIGLMFKFVSEVAMTPNFQNREKCIQFCETCTPREQNVLHFFDKHS